MPRDYYQVLGVDRDAGIEEIKKAFRRLARETHPDANPGDPAAEGRFREAAEAYEVLADPSRRARYDRGDTIDLGDLFNGMGGIDDLLRSVFGDGGFFGSGGGRRSTRGRDVLVTAEVSLEEAAFGTEATVEFHSLQTCQECGGTGAEPGSDRMTCPDCDGAGRVRVAQRSLFGTMMSVTACRRCSGEGVIVTEACHVCDGSGAVPEDSRVSVEIPPGVSSGTRLRLGGRGESGGRHGPSGDLYVEVAVSDDPRFERYDADLIHHVVVGLAEATLGTRVEVPLIDGGSTDLEVPGGTQPGTSFVIRGSGMHRLGQRSRGDLIVVVDVAIPDDLTQDEEELLRRWAELRGEKIDRPAGT